jgi:hypothetical protein
MIWAYRRQTFPCVIREALPGIRSVAEQRAASAGSALVAPQFIRGEASVANGVPSFLFFSLQFDTVDVQNGYELGNPSLTAAVSSKV